MQPASALSTSVLWAPVLFAGLLLLGFYPTTESMVSIWLRSETFAHGFLIFPISLWLIWDDRARLATISMKPAPLILLLTLPVGLAWLLGSLVDVLVVQQFALVLMLIVGVWVIVGHEMIRAAIFPLGFLLMAVPVGEGLIPPMMEFTATTTVWLIQLSDIPVFREGLYFSLPTGNWSVVEACSGVRYLIASFTLGLLYAHLTYRSIHRKLLFIFASLVIPVLANTARAYLIVMLGHLSNMKLATGADHLVYGWVFFGVVVTLLFWAGSFFREDYEETPEKRKTYNQRSVSGGTGASVWLAVGSALVAALVWPVLAASLPAKPVSQSPDPAMIRLDGSWRLVEEDKLRYWEPGSAVEISRRASFQHPELGELVLVIQKASSVDQEVVGSINAMNSEDSSSKVISSSGQSIMLHGETFKVRQANMRSSGSLLTAWSWYELGGASTSNDYVGKWYELLGRLGVMDSRSYRIVVAAPTRENSVNSLIMSHFLRSNLPSLKAVLYGDANGER